MAHDLGEIRPPHRIAAGQDQDRRRRSERTDLIDQAERISRVELARIAPADRVGAAVDAGERAGPRHFPDDQEGCAAEVDGGEIGTRHGSERRIRLRAAPMTAVILPSPTT